MSSIKYRRLFGIFIGFKETVVCGGTQSEDNTKHSLFYMRSYPFPVVARIIDDLATFNQTFPQCKVTTSCMGCNLDISRDLKNLKLPIRFSPVDEIQANDYLRLIYALSNQRIVIEDSKLKKEVERRLNHFDLDNPDVGVSSIALLGAIGKPVTGIARSQLED